MALKPQPVNKHIICSVCGLDWDRHKKPAKAAAVPLDECIRLLKVDLATASRARWPQQGIIQAGSNTAGGGISFSGYTI